MFEKMMAASLVLAMAGCVVGSDEDVDRRETVAAYSDGPTCVVYWLDFVDVTSSTGIDACDHRAGEIGNQHFEEIRGGAPGDNSLELYFAFYDPATDYYLDGIKYYFCE